MVWYVKDVKTLFYSLEMYILHILLRIHCSEVIIYICIYLLGFDSKIDPNTCIFIFTDISGKTPKI